MKTRTGLIAQKLGMTSVYDDKGIHTPVTLLKVDNCQVVAVQTKEKNGYVALQLGAGAKRAKTMTKPMLGHLGKAGVGPKAKIVEFRVSDDAVLDVGTEITVEHFVPGQYVDVRGVTLGHGYTGVMKRWNFRGLEASHGVSVSHRSPGSTGQRQDPGKVFKNKKMAGHDGDANRTVQNLRVVGVDLEKGLIWVNGSLPGHKNGWVTIQDAVKINKQPVELPYPAATRGAPAAAAAAPEAPAAENNQG